MSDRRRSDRDERDVRRSDRDDYRDRSDRDRDRDRDDYRSGRSDRDRSDRDRDRYASDVRDRDRSKRSRERDDGARGSRRDDERDAKRRRDDDVTDRGRGASSSSSSYADAQHARAMGVTSSGADDDDGMEVVQPTEEELEEARRVEALLQNSSGAHHREAKIAGIRPTEKLSARPEPVSIEELAKQRAQESAKPKFLTKEERQRLALERRAAQVKEKQEKTAEIRESRQQFFHQADDAPPGKPDLIDDRRGGGGRDRERERDRDRDRDRDRSDRDRDRDRERERDHWRDRRNDDLEKNRVGGGGSSSSDRGRERDYRDDRGGRGRDEAGDRQDRDRDRRREELEKKENLTREESQELSEIKAHYLGLKKEKRKVVKPSEKFKFVFAWDLSEDTSRDHNPLYNQRLDVRPSFGRGFLAGIDQKQQLKAFEADKDHSRVARVERRLDESYLGRGDTGRHWSQKALAEMTQRDWRIFKEDHSISTKGGRVPVPMRNWGESKLPTVLLDAIESAGYKQPMPIQMQSIPIGLQGRDLIGLAETGSGKTCAFVLPMLVYISKLPPMTAENAADGPYALIMAPTRELALQIEQEAAKFAGAMGFRTVAVVGGQSIEEQGFALRRGAEILIATPGRLVDCLEQRYVVLNQCNYVVLDEADRMVDMGFEVQVTTILDAMPSSNLKSEDETTAEEQMAALQEEKPDHVYRTTVMFSATMPVAVERLARKYLRHPAVIQIGEVGKAGEKIEQRVEFVKGDNDKKNKLLNLLYSGIAPPIMVFVNQKKNCDIISRAINKAGFRSATLHSGKSQELREEAMDGFKAGTIDILVSTDVAGRGIDVKGVTHVINYDMAKSIADYTHRIGRTGRAGMKGVAISFITNDDADLFYDLKQMLQASGNPVPNELAHHPAAKIKPGAAGTQGKTRRETVIYAP